MLIHTESIELTAFLPTLDNEGKFSPGFELCSHCVLSSPGFIQDLFEDFSLSESTHLTFGPYPFLHWTVPVGTVPIGTQLAFGPTTVWNWAGPTITVMAFGLIPFRRGCIPVETVLFINSLFFSKKLDLCHQNFLRVPPFWDPS